MEEPVRLVQTNLRESDTGLDPARLIEQVDALNANALLIGMGGIVAHYPTQVPLHIVSRGAKPGGDMFGEVLRFAKMRRIRVIGRFDLSKAQKPVFDAHPEWFFQRADGTPVVYNGLYSTCINGGYYRDHAMKFLTEALERYEVDGLFFNMFGNPATDYSGKPTGNCHCAECKKREADGTAHAAQIARGKNEVAAAIGSLIHAKRPGAAFWTYLQDHVDGIMSESNTAVDRPLPLWPYSASDNVNRARNSQPGKMAFNLCIGFVDIPYRMTTVPPAEIETRLYQNMAHGAGPAFVALGTLDQEDRAGLAAAKRVFAVHRRRSAFYVGQESAARVMLVGGRGANYQGLFRMLSELHIPFAVSDNFDWVGKREFDVVVTAAGIPKQLAGLKVVATGAVAPEVDLGVKPVRVRTETRSAYFRIHDRGLLPSLKDTNLLFLDGPMLQYPPREKAALTFIPPSMYGPPELVFSDAVETQVPGLILADNMVFVPWEIGALYHRHSAPAHRRMMEDLLRLFQPKRQVVTNAHPLVEITVMRQPALNRTLVHFVNLSGHSSTAWHEPVPMRNVNVDLLGKFTKAYSLDARDVPVRQTGEYTQFQVPALAEYEVVILE